jgi:hypothetical protein
MLKEPIFILKELILLIDREVEQQEDRSVVL